MQNLHLCTEEKIICGILFLLMLQMQPIGKIGIGQQCLIPAEVLMTPTRSKGQILPATADGVLRITAISRAKWFGESHEYSGARGSSDSSWHAVNEITVKPLPNQN